jgi:2-polyprenyl-3-methyl-5-hydroxy-6-metoxy-1,4-benzoquinol methylase
MSINIVQQYGWNSAEPPESCDYLAPEVHRLLTLLGAKRVLDLGCGNGALCNSISRLGYDVIGMDNDRGAIELAKSAYPTLRFIQGKVEDEPSSELTDGHQFDVVVSTEVVEHLFSPHQLPLFAAKVLRPGGHLILSTPYHGYLKNLALAITGKWDSHHTPLWHGGHIKFWSRESLSELLRRSGFSTIRFVGVGRAPYLWKSMILVAQSTGEITR